MRKEKEGLTGRNLDNLIKIYKDKAVDKTKDKKQISKNITTEIKKVKKNKSEFELTSFQIYSFIISLIVIMITACLPVISYYNATSSFNLVSDYLSTIASINQYSFNLQKTVILSEKLLINNAFFKAYPSINTESFNNLDSAYNDLLKIQTNFSNFYINLNGKLKTDITNLMTDDLCATYTNFSYSFPNCVQFAKANSIPGLNIIFGNIQKNIYQVILSYNLQPNKFISTFYENTNFINGIYLMEQIGYSSFNLMESIVQSNINIEILSIKNTITILACLYCFIIIFNQIIVWRQIVQKIHMIELDTNKLFGVLPLKFISEYPKLYNYLKSLR